MKACLVALLAAAVSLGLFAQAENPVRLSGESETNLGVVFFDTNHPSWSSGYGEATSVLTEYLRPTLVLKPVEGLGTVVRAEVSISDKTWSSPVLKLLETYLTIDVGDWLRVDFGKKRLEWGRAQLFNPTNFFQKSIDPLAPRNGIDGVPMLHFGVLSEFITWEILGTYDTLPGNWGAGTRLAVNKVIPETDVGVVFYGSQQRDVCFGFTVDSTPLATAGFLSDLDVYFETGFSRKSVLPVPQNGAAGPALAERAIRQNPLADGFYAGLVGGLRFSVPYVNTMVLAEYSWRDSGLTADEISFMSRTGLYRQYPVDSSKVARNTLFLSLWQDSFTARVSQFTDTLGGGVSAIICLDDSSATFNAKLESGIIENLIITVEGSIPLGEKQKLWTASPQRWVLTVGARTAF